MDLLVLQIFNIAFHVRNSLKSCQKLISFPLYLLSMSILSGIMIINLGKTSNYTKYGIYGVLISVILYFLNDLSITMAKSDIISVDFSVWIPIFLIVLTNMVGITQVNAK